MVTLISIIIVCYFNNGTFFVITSIDNAYTLFQVFFKISFRLNSKKIESRINEGVVFTTELLV